MAEYRSKIVLPGGDSYVVAKLVGEKDRRFNRYTRADAVTAPFSIGMLHGMLSALPSEQSIVAVYDFSEQVSQPWALVAVHSVEQDKCKELLEEFMQMTGSKELEVPKDLNLEGFQEVDATLPFYQMLRDADSKMKGE